MRVQRDLALAQLATALGKLGMVPVETVVTFELDHDPALAIRPINAAGTDYEPPQHAIAHLVWRPKSDHAIKTTGRLGESDLSVTFNGDTSRAAKVKRIEADQAEARSRILAKAPGEPPVLKGTIRGRPKADRQAQRRASSALSKTTNCFR